MKLGHNHAAGSLISRLELLARCPLCQSAFTKKEIHRVKQYPNHELLHMACPTCFASLLAIIVPSERGMSLVGTMTDLSHGDAQALLRMNVICDDELLSCVAMLKQGGVFEKYLSAV